jgi:hypothetical protein
MFNEKQIKFQIKLLEPGKSPIFLMAILTKLSQKSRELVVYCPFLIWNETDKILLFRENGYTGNIPSDKMMDEKKEEK